MQQHNPPAEKVKEINVVAGLKIIETEYKVKSPVFEDIKIDRPIFVDKTIEVPVGFEKVINELALKIADNIMDKVEIVLGARLDKAITERISTIKSPKIIEELNIIKKDVHVDNAVIKDVTIERSVFVDKEVINPVLKDVEVINAVIADKTVINAVITDQKITNAIIKDVEVERAIIREKVIDVIHPRYLKLNGEPE